MMEDTRMKTNRFKFFELASNFNFNEKTKKNRRSKKRVSIMVELTLKIVENPNANQM
jgi:hypothetical protein